MAVDNVARGLAAAARDGALPSVPQFSNLGSITVPPAHVRIEAGNPDGTAIYIADAEATAALASAHPRFCKADAAGRHFRLLPTSGAISVEQGGASGSGNDQPAIQATLDYAAAVGIETVTFGRAAYESWASAKTSHYDGNHMVVTASVALVGRPGGTTITLKNSLGGSTMTITQSYFANPWRGNGIAVWPNRTLGTTMDFLSIENLTLDGGFSGSVASNHDSDVSQKGLQIGDVGIERVLLRNCEFRNMSGEIIYTGGGVLRNGGAVGELVAENVKVHGSGQCAWNPASVLKLHAVNVEAGRAYQAAEILGLGGHTYVGCRFYDCYNSTFFGGPDPDFASGYPYSWPRRRDDAPPPYIHFENTRFENCNLNLGSWIRGRLITIDSTVSLNAAIGHLRDIDLTIETWVDRSNNFGALELSGPQSATEQVPGAPAGVYVSKPGNIRVHLIGRTTALASANQRRIGQAVVYSAGLYDTDTVRFVVEGEFRRLYDVYGTPPPGFALPRMEIAGFLAGTEQPYGGTYADLQEDTALRVAWNGITFYQSFVGTVNVSLDMTYGYAHGQQVTFFYGAGAADRIVSFGKNASGLMLNADRTLRRRGEFLTVEFNAFAGKFVEQNYVGQGA